VLRNLRARTSVEALTASERQMYDASYEALIAPLVASFSLSPPDAAAFIDRALAELDDAT
jgi:RNA polymerase-interacting CarD/CdnL/TRCF family regulator